MSVYEGLKPKLVWDHFYQLNQIPRCSGNEEGARNYVISVAERLGLEYQVDKVGNTVVRKPASNGMENKPIVIIQNHLDMVCEKNKGTVHDFGKDAIKPLIDGEWVKADGTTLGADNGIGACMALAAMEDDTLEHPPLELLFTIEEETGLTGAVDLDVDMLQGRVLINLDSEEEGDLYIGCAGGQHTIMTKHIGWGTAPEGHKTVLLKVSGLRGGHSGLNIADEFGNAIRLLARILNKLGNHTSFSLAAVNGGTAHNAIPREADALLVVNDGALQALKELAREYETIFNDELKFTEKNIKVTVSDHDPVKKVFAGPFTASLIRFLYSAPHGVQAMSKAVPGLVETSTNLAIVETRDDELFILTSQRSSVGSAVDDIADRVRALAELAHFDVEQGGGYPAWQPNPQSKLLDICKDVYKKRFSKEINVKVIHAGLECGIIGDMVDGMDMISFGPDIVGAHSPDERVRIASVDHIWEYLRAILKSF